MNEKKRKIKRESSKLLPPPSSADRAKTSGRERSAYDRSRAGQQQGIIAGDVTSCILVTR